MTDVLGFLYAAVVAAGGIVGYMKAGSTTSLAAGVGFGAIAGAGAYLTSQNPNNFWLLMGTSATLAGVMGYRFANSGKFMPAGLVFGLSLLMAGRLALRMIQK